MLPANWRKRFRGACERDHALAPLTTYRIGGPADLYLEPATVGDLVTTVAQLWRIGLPYRILGGGSNLLVSDRGVTGAVVSLARLDRVWLAGDDVVAEAGAHLHSVVTWAADRGRAGLENLTGIPGRVGGAVFGNAGSRHGAIGAAVTALDLLEPDGHLARIRPDRDFFRYRGSRVGSRIVVRALLATEPGARAVLRTRKCELLKERRRTQPGWVGNAGCVFKNPPGDSAGRLIDTAECKGMTQGRIQVSAKHANFFENAGGGTADDVLFLADRVRDRVRSAHGVDLEMEVKRWR